MLKPSPLGHTDAPPEVLGAAGSLFLQGADDCEVTVTGVCRGKCLV